MPPEGVQQRRHEDLLTFEQMTAVARTAVRLGVTKIRLTGGEPLVKRDIVELVRMIAGIEGLRHLGMTTNGTLLKGFARSLREAELNSLNISLDTLDPERYRFLTRGGRIEDALAGIDAAREEQFPVKINMVVLRDTASEEIVGMRRFCAERGLRLQLINHFDLGREKSESYGFDRPPSCARCNRIRLLADGMLRPCLHCDLEVKLDFSRLEESLREAVFAKPERGGICRNGAMSQIGG
jgi:cyclic pyranopterin phosphate synthase